MKNSETEISLFQNYTPTEAPHHTRLHQCGAIGREGRAERRVEKNNDGGECEEGGA